MSFNVFYFSVFFAQVLDNFCNQKENGLMLLLLMRVHMVELSQEF